MPTPTTEWHLNWLVAAAGLKSTLTMLIEFNIARRPDSAKPRRFPAPRWRTGVVQPQRQLQDRRSVANWHVAETPGIRSFKPDDRQGFFGVNMADSRIIDVVADLLGDTVILRHSHQFAKLPGDGKGVSLH